MRRRGAKGKIAGVRPQGNRVNEEERESSYFFEKK
jgi:hypothetical protein